MNPYAEILSPHGARPRVPACPVGQRVLVLGSSMGVVEHYRAARARADQVWTCNAGVQCEARPDLYWLTDPQAAEQWIGAAARLASTGAHVLTSPLTVGYYAPIGDWATAFVAYDHRHERRWTPGRLCNGRTSGCFLAQLAVIGKAAEVHLVGMAGYRSRPGRVVCDYADGRAGLEKHARVMRFYGPMLQSLIDQSRRVRFVFYGLPNWDWHGPNVQVLQAPAPAPVEDAA